MYNKPIINFSTKLGFSAISIIRVSFGKIKKKILYFFFKKFFCKIVKPQIINYLNFYDFKNNIIDKGLGLYFISPKSYTGEDLFEFHGHGNPYILKNLLKQILLFFKKYGLIKSKKGYFTKKAFLNNKIDLFELNFLLNILKNFNFKLLLNNFKFNLNYKLIKILKLINYLEILNVFNKKINYNKIFYYLKYIKKEILFIIKNINFKKVFLKNIIILGLVNTGKSTFFNIISKNHFSIISDFKGTTKGMIKKKIKFKNFYYNFFDSLGFDYNQNIIDHLNLTLIIKKLFKFELILYLFDNIIFYNSFFYFIKKRIIKNNIIFKLINKIDFLNLNSSLEYYFFNFKFININLSSKKKIGLFFVLNEIKKNSFLNYFNFNNIFLKIMKKCYKLLIKSFIFLKNKKLFLLKIIKMKNYFNLILKKKNKKFFNKIFKSFCLGK